MSKALPIKRRSPARKDTLMRRFAETLGRDELMVTLDLSMEPRAFALLNMMADPEYRRHSFGKLCEKAGLDYRELLDIFRRTHLDVAMIRAVTHIPRILADIAEDAESHTVACLRCDGQGRIFDDRQANDERLCPKCAGTGSVRVPGDSKARDQVLELVGLTGRRKQFL